MSSKKDNQLSYKVPTPNQQANIGIQRRDRGFRREALERRDTCIANRLLNFKIPSLLN